MFNSIKSMNAKPHYWLLLVLVISLLSGCSPKPPIRNFSDADLLIDKSVMPQEWEVAESGKDLDKDEGENSKAYIIFYRTATSYFVRGGEDVYRYSDSSKAAWHYDRLAKDYFNDAGFYRTTPWQTPSGFTLSSSSAHKWRFACAGSNFSTGPQDGSNSILCGYLAQYDEFLVFFSVTTEIDGHTFITLDELSPIIKALDQRMGMYLGPGTKP